MNLHQAIKQGRIDRGLSQLQFSELLGVPQPRVSEWESGKHMPSADTIRRIEKVLNVTFVVSVTEPS